MFYILQKATLKFKQKLSIVICSNHHLRFLADLFFARMIDPIWNRKVFKIYPSPSHVNES